MLSFILWFSLSLGIQEQLLIEYPIFTEIEIHAESEYIDLYGIYENEMEPFEFPYFNPMQDTFTVGAKIGTDNLSLNIEHMCSHAVNPFGINKHPRDKSYNKLWVEISSK